MSEKLTKKNVITLLVIGITLMVIPFSVKLAQEQQFLKSFASQQGEIKFSGEGVDCKNEGQGQGQGQTNNCTTTNTKIEIELVSPLGDAAPPGGIVTPQPSSVPTATPAPVTSNTITVNTTSSQAGQEISVSWTMLNPEIKDWAGLYAIINEDEAHGGKWFYTSSCTRSAGGAAKNRGTCNYTIPQGTTPGQYQFRLFYNDDFTRAAVSSNIEITGG
ncbi:MAG: hypothetical protein C4584_02775 [Armatimonadetes bacterium]|nr:MAG: hypothetical protein C4584_02775 [Armatimonadota bacterium]